MENVDVLAAGLRHCVNKDCNLAPVEEWWRYCPNCGSALPRKYVRKERK